MGLFSKKQSTGGFTRVEQQIVDFYAAMLSSNGLSKVDVADAMREQIVESKGDGSYYLPLDIGDIVLSPATPSDPALVGYRTAMRRLMAQKRLDGMTDADFREYWNEPETARRIAAWHANLSRMAMFRQVMASGAWGSVEEGAEAAAARVKMIHATFGHPTGDEDLSDPHRPLPWEVRTRVTNFMNARNGDLSALEATLEASGTANAYYRSSLR